MRRTTGHNCASESGRRGAPLKKQRVMSGFSPAFRIDITHSQSSWIPSSLSSSYLCVVVDDGDSFPAQRVARGVLRRKLATVERKPRVAPCVVEVGLRRRFEVVVLQDALWLLPRRRLLQRQQANRNTLITGAPVDG